MEYFKNGSPKSRSFACIDETRLCDPTNTYCWHEYAKIPDPVSHIAKDPAYWFMVNALKKSNTYDSIKLRLGSSLLAQQRVGEARSQALANNHWELEAEHMFKTSLARAQFDAWSLASGEDHDQDTYKNTVDEFAESMCGLFKFRAAGHVNIRMWPFWLLCSVLPITFLLSVELKTYRQICHGAMRSARGQLVKKSKAPTSDSAADALVADSDTNDDAFVVGSTSSTRRSSETSAAPVVNPAPQSDTRNVRPSTDDSLILSDAANDRPLPTSTTTRLIVRLAHEPHNYGTHSAAHSIRTSRSSAYMDRSASTIDSSARPVVNDGEVSQPSDQNDHEWSPLLIHGPILMGARIVKAMGGRRGVEGFD